jgi:heme A synthase
LFFVGSALAGAGFGASFQGAIRSVLLLAAPHERAGVLSVFYLIAYLAMGLPAILGGLRVVHGGGLFGTAREYGLAVMTFGALALIGSLLRRQRKPSASAALALALAAAAPRAGAPS